MRKLPELETLLKYENPLVIKRFQRAHPEWMDQASILFKEMLKYLWLCKKHEHDTLSRNNHPDLAFTCVMHQEMVPIDEMWHSFILITRDYEAFCHQYFGGFIHHVPELGEQVVNPDRPVNKALFQKELELFLSYVYDHLGEETVYRWFSRYMSNFGESRKLFF